MTSGVANERRGMGIDCQALQAFSRGSGDQPRYCERRPDASYEVPPWASGRIVEPGGAGEIISAEQTLVHMALSVACERSRAYLRETVLGLGDAVSAFEPASPPLLNVRSTASKKS